MHRAAYWIRRHAGVRTATSLAASGAVTLALVLGSVLLVVRVRSELTHSVVTGTEQRAQDVAGGVSSDGLARVSLFSRGGERSVAQVLLGDRVVLSSPDVAGQQALTPLRPQPGQLVERQVGPLPSDDDDRHVVTALGAVDPEGTAYTVVVVQSLADVQSAVGTVTTLLAVGIPVLALLVGVTTFVLTGRALRPVEAIRRRVSDIDAAGLGRRVPVPTADDEVRRLALTMNDMLSRLEAASAAQRAFVSDASHELRSPLTNVRATVEVAQVHPADADWPQVGTVVLAELARLEGLVSDLLLLARADEGALELHLTEVDLDDLVGNEAHRALGRVGLSVQVDLAPTKVRGDSRRLSQIISNLVGNAARHARTLVRLELAAVGSAVVLTVSDDGPGLCVADRERVFERFVRVDDGRGRRDGGTGLGLSIVRELVQAHGGDVAFVDPGPGVGCAVRVRLPILPD